MALRRKAQQVKEPAEDASAPYDAVWGVPPRFNAVHDIVDAGTADPARTALVHVSADGTLTVSTFLDVVRDSTRWSRLLLANAVEPGDRVLVALEPGAVWAATILGAMRIGAIPVPIGADHDLDGLVIRAGLVEPTMLVVARRGAESGDEGTERLTEGLHVIAVDETQASLVRPGSPTPPRETAADEPAAILFTRGRSTGAPRPVLHAHAAAFAAGRIEHEWLGVSSGDVVWCDAPGGSATALWHGLFGPWQLGATVLLVDPTVPDHEKAITLERFQPSVIVHPPSRIAALLDLRDRTELRLDGLRSAGSTDDPLDQGLAARFVEATGVRLSNGWGTTETGTLVFQPRGSDAPPVAVGVPAEGVIVSPVDAEGYASPDGVVGDLALYGRPASLCLGYWEGAMPARPPAGGEWWTLTGDRASFDQSGQLWLEPTGAAPTGAEGERAAPVDEQLLPVRPSHG